MGWEEVTMTYATPREPVELDADNLFALDYASLSIIRYIVVKLLDRITYASISFLKEHNVLI